MKQRQNLLTVSEREELQSDQLIENMRQLLLTLPMIQAQRDTISAALAEIIKLKMLRR